MIASRKGRIRRENTTTNNVATAGKNTTGSRFTILNNDEVPMQGESKEPESTIVTGSSTPRLVTFNQDKISFTQQWKTGNRSSWQKAKQKSQSPRSTKDASSRTTPTPSP